MVHNFEDLFSNHRSIDVHCDTSGFTNRSSLTNPETIPDTNSFSFPFSYKLTKMLNCHHQIRNLQCLQTLSLYVLYSIVHPVLLIVLGCTCSSPVQLDSLDLTSSTSYLPRDTMSKRTYQHQWF